MDEFLGTYTPRLDDKGRLFLPARFRSALAAGLVVTTGQEGCLYVFPTQEFHRISALMQSAPGSSRQVRDFVRVFRASAHPDTPDKQGRVTVEIEIKGLDKVTRGIERAAARVAVALVVAAFATQLAPRLIDLGTPVFVSIGLVIFILGIGWLVLLMRNK